MAIQQSINQAIGTLGVMAGMSGKPQEKLAERKAEKEATVEKEITEKLMNKEVAAGNFTKEGEGVNTSYTITKKKYSPEEITRLEENLSAANEAELKVAKLRGDTDRAANIIKDMQNTRQAISTLRQRNTNLDALRETAVKKAKEAEAAKLKQKEEYKSFLNKKIFEEQAKAREGLLGLGDEAYKLAAKQSDKHIKETIMKQYKGLKRG